MIDEKGRLFGKINVVDLLIVIVLILALTFVGIKVLNAEAFNNGNETEKDIILIVNCRYTPFYTAEKLVAGASAYDSDDDITLGTLESWEYEPYYEYSEGKDNEYRVESDYFTGVTLRIKAKGSVVENGVKIDDKTFGSGHSMVVFFNDAKLYVRVCDYEIL